MTTKFAAEPIRLTVVTAGLTTLREGSWNYAPALSASVVPRSALRVAVCQPPKIREKAAWRAKAATIAAGPA